MLIQRIIRNNNRECSTQHPAVFKRISAVHWLLSSYYKVKTLRHHTSINSRQVGTALGTISEGLDLRQISSALEYIFLDLNHVSKDSTIIYLRLHDVYLSIIIKKLQEHIDLLPEEMKLQQEHGITEEFTYTNYIETNMMFFFPNIVPVGSYPAPEPTASAKVI